MENKPAVSSQTWLLRYIVTAETAALIMMIGFFSTGYQDLVTKKELEKLPYPFLPERSVIRNHIEKSEKALDRINETIHALNERITKESHAQDLRIQILEEDLKLRRKGR